MADLRYRIAKIPARKNQEPHWSRPYRKLPNALAVLRAKLLLSGAPYSVNRRGSRPGSVPTLAKALARVRRAAQRQANAGEVYIIRGANGTGYMLRIIEVNPPVDPPSSATPAIQRIYVKVMSRHPEIQNLGICNCRKIDGSSTWSQHSWCNGWDIAGSVKVIDQIERELRGDPDVAQFLWRGVANHYPGHAHISGSPMKGGTPPCAKG